MSSIIIVYSPVSSIIQVYAPVSSIILVYLKFGDGDGPNLYREKKVDVSSTFYWNYISV